MKYLITALEIHDFKSIHDIMITPAADAVWILLGGDNANGKTGVLEAIEALFGGADAVIEGPVRHGAERAEIRGKLQPDGDAPALTVRRRIEIDGSTTLEVRDDIGKVRAQQSLLDALLGKRFLDPIEFLRLKGPAQRAKLLEIIDTDGELAKIEDRRQRLFDRRTEVGRDLKRATGAVDSTPEVTPDEPTDVSALTDELRQLHDKLTAQARALHLASDAERVHKEAENAVGVCELAVERAQRALTLARERFSQARAAASAAHEAVPSASVAESDQRRTAIQHEIRQAGAHNDAVAAQRAAQARRAHLVNERDKHQYEHDELERQIEAIDAAKKARLLAAKLPIADLAFTEVGVTYKGSPLSSASGAQRMCVAIAMAAAAQPQLRDVWIRDAAILDDNTMRQVAEFAREHGIRPWLERVGTRDDGVIEVREGRIAEPSQRGLFK